MDPDCLAAGGVVIVVLIVRHLIPALYDTDQDHPDATLKADREGDPPVICTEPEWGHVDTQPDGLGDFHRHGCSGADGKLDIKRDRIGD
jgi:hypothetical protein